MLRWLYTVVFRESVFLTVVYGRKIFLYDVYSSYITLIFSFFVLVEKTEQQIHSRGKHWNIEEKIFIHIIIIIEEHRYTQNLLILWTENMHMTYCSIMRPYPFLRLYRAEHHNDTTHNTEAKIFFSQSYILFLLIIYINYLIPHNHSHSSSTRTSL